MKNFFKKFSLFLISFIFILSSLSSSAFSSELNSKLITYQNSMQKDLIKFVESSNNSNSNNFNKLKLEKFIKNDIYKKYNLNYEDFKKISQQSNNQIQKLKSLNYSNQKIADSQIIKTVKTKNNYLIEFYNNGCFSIENLNNINKVSNGAVWGQAYKDYYSWIGLHIFSVAVCSSFGYNGKKAYYNGNFDAYYERGFLSIWQVSNWSKWKESVGSSYKINASGNFHYGFEVDGIGIVIQDLYIKQSVTCDKHGNITQYFNH